MAHWCSNVGFIEKNLIGFAIELKIDYMNMALHFWWDWKEIMSRAAKLHSNKVFFHLLQHHLHHLALVFIRILFSQFICAYFINVIISIRIYLVVLSHKLACIKAMYLSFKYVYFITYIFYCLSTSSSNTIRNRDIKFAQYLHTFLFTNRKRCWLVCRSVCIQVKSLSSTLPFGKRGKTDVPFDCVFMHRGGI